ncbi:hypothetical protein GCM10025881_30300 [Pseudolysinimonas kribbensis]|uniref:CoA carboxyltransferase N-terminal domain-containing protein n=1 Tax=Pseudolysinimonas kribbensis TaxID=433641 RepID=A0ABQ6K6F0_9MICO|nr:hypothetical protein GCM10025881_30300 [Pseudolysinimonas kribbensis]
MSDRRSARELLHLVLDADSFVSWDVPVADPVDAVPAYRASLARARERTGLDEAVLTGRGTIGGVSVAVVVSEFGFLGGSVGVACADRIEAAARRATREALPLLAAPASGGTRMQEGTIAFLQMVRISAAILDHKTAGLPYLVYLRDPTTGGVLASWASLGHVTVAEPGALIGFLGPRVSEAITGEAFPDGVQRAENLAAHGIIDAVVPPEALGALAARALRLIGGRGAPQARVETTSSSGRVLDTRTEPAARPADSVWDDVLRTRDPRRPGIRQLLRYAASNVLPLSGTAEGSSTPAC